MSILYINGVKASGAGTSLIMPAYSPAGNNLLVLVVGVFAYSRPAMYQISMPSVTDSAGNGWETLGASPCSEGVYGSGGESGWQLFAFYVRWCSGQSAIVNITLPGDECAMAAALQEYSGVNGVSCLDNVLMNEGLITSMSPSVNTGSIYTTQASDLLFSAAFDNGNGVGTAHTFTPSGGYTTRQSLSDATNSLNLATFDTISGAAGSTYSNTVSVSGASDGAHCLIIAFTAAPVTNPILQVAASMGSPDGANQGTGVAQFPRPNVAGHSILLLVWGASNQPTDTLGNTYFLDHSFGGFNLYIVEQCLGGKNIVTVTGLNGIGGHQTPFVALETYQARHLGDNFGTVTPGVEVGTGDIGFVSQGDLLLTVGLASGSGVSMMPSILATQQQRIGGVDILDKQFVQFSGLGAGTNTPWGGSMWWYVYPSPGPGSYGSELQVTSPVDLTAAIIGFTITYPPSGAPNNSLLIWDNSYSRFRNQSYSATPLFLEDDTNLLLMATEEAGGYAIRYLDYIDYNDGGWSGGVQVQEAIPVNIQLPEEDIKLPHFPKQWNMVEMDVNTRGQNLTVILNFDDAIGPITIGVVNTSTRQKVQLFVNGGLGQESYKCSPELQISVLVAPNIYQMNIYAAPLAAFRNAFDTYWIKFGTDESKLVKEGYFDYTAPAGLTVALYADGSTTPYYTFDLPANPTRSAVPERVRFPAIKLRQFRMVVVGPSLMPFQFWAAPWVRWKPCLVGAGYQRAELVT